MSFQNYWPFLFLIFIPIIILLYLLKQKAEDLPFSSLMLWREAYKNTEAATPWEKLKNNLLMILQIIAVLLLVLALAFPFLNSGGDNSAQVIISIDTSGSMNIKYDEENTRFEKAVALAEEYVDSLKEGTAVTLVNYNSSATVEAANVTSKTEVKNKLKALKPTHLPGDFQKALNLVESMAGQWDAYQAVFYSDELFTVDKKEISFVDVNSEVVNVCISSVSTRIDENELTVLVQVDNPSPYEFTTDINLYMDDAIVDIKNITLTAEDSQVLFFEGLLPEGQIIKAEINEKDAMAEDNAGYALLEDSIENAALLVSDQNLFLEKAIVPVSGVELYKTNDMKNLGEDDEFNLYIFDGVVPEILPKKGNIIFVNPDGLIPEITGEPESFSNQLVQTASGEAVRYLDDFSFGVTQLSCYEKPVWAESFFESGNKSAGFVGTYEGRTIAVLGFDIHNTDFPLQAEFPIFIHNLLSICTESGLVSRNTYTVGDGAEITPDPEGLDIMVERPDGNTDKIIVTDMVKTYDSLDYAGLYTLIQPVGESQETAVITVAFPTGEESAVTRNEVQQAEELSQQPAAQGSGRDLKNWFIGAVLLILVIEWIIYLKRI